MTDILESDFWWLGNNQKEALFVGVGHHRPLTDDDNPLQVPWVHSVQDDKLSQTKKLYPLDFIVQWRAICSNINVYRTLTLFNHSGQPVRLGPFLVDIDNSNWTNGYVENLEDALAVARRVCVFLVETYKIATDDLRVLFSGRKGFNIEVCPRSLKIQGSHAQQIRLSALKQEEIICHFGKPYNVVTDHDTTIDRVYGISPSVKQRKKFGLSDSLNDYSLRHCYIRLHDSVNRWVAHGGEQRSRRKLELTLNELNRLSAQEILAIAAA